MKVYKAISSVAEELSKTGISKDRKNPAQGYRFRGIDDVYQALSTLLPKHGLVILPKVISRECTERQTAKGGTMFYTVVHMDFDFISSEDGSTHVVSTAGEAMDSGDKSTNKAMSAAYKYACLQAFCIPTEGDNDTENSSPEVAAPTGNRDKPPYQDSDIDKNIGGWKSSGVTGKQVVQRICSKYTLSDEQADKIMGELG